MHRAIEQGQIKVVRLLLGRPETDIHQREKNGLTPLLKAYAQLCEYKQCDITLNAWVEKLEAIIELLLESGANARNECREKESRHRDEGFEYVEGAVDVVDSDDEETILIATTLSLAIGRARPPLLQRLVDEGADVISRIAFYDQDGTRDTTLLQLASRWQNVAAVRFLLEERPEGPNMACLRDSRGILPLLLAAIGFYPNLRKFEGRLSDADVTYHATETIKMLLSQNDVDERAARSMTALSLAAHYHQPPGTRFSSSRYDPVVQLLLDHGANTCDADDNYGDTPLHTAVWTGDRIGTVRLLLLHGALPDVRNHQGDTPFHIATTIHRFHASARRFEDDQKDGFQRRSLEKQQQEVMRLLLDALAGDYRRRSTDILDQPNDEGKSPRQIRQLVGAENERARERLAADRAQREAEDRRILAEDAEADRRRLERKGRDAV